MADKIGNTELSAYGLKLGALDGNSDLPAFKRIIKNHNFEPELLKLDEKTVKIRLFGIYANKGTLTQNVENFKLKIKENLKQTWTFINHGFQELCVVKEGARFEIHGGRVVEIYLTLTIIEPDN